MRTEKIGKKNLTVFTAAPLLTLMEQMICVFKYIYKLKNSAQIDKIHIEEKFEYKML